MAMMPDEPLIDGRGEGHVLGYEIDRPDAGSPSIPVVVEGGGDRPRDDHGTGPVTRPKLRRRL
jgi:hypothetical protein